MLQYKTFVDAGWFKNNIANKQQLYQARMGADQAQ